MKIKLLVSFSLLIGIIFSGYSFFNALLTTLWSHGGILSNFTNEPLFASIGLVGLILPFQHVFFAERYQNKPHLTFSLPLICLIGILLTAPTVFQEYQSIIHDNTIVVDFNGEDRLITESNFKWSDDYMYVFTDTTDDFLFFVYSFSFLLLSEGIMFFHYRRSHRKKYSVTQ